MKRNFNKKTQRFKGSHNGYVLYDQDLNQKEFMACLTQVIDLHDVFKHHIQNQTVIKSEAKINFGEIHTFDQISFKDDLEALKSEKSLEESAEFRLIYFHNNLRGFYFRLNSILFDDASVKKIILSIEHQYFKRSIRQSGTSYSKWLEKTNKSFADQLKKGQYDSTIKELVIDEQLTTRIKAYIKTQEITSYQFFTGIIGLYFKSTKNKELVFQSNLFEEKHGVIGFTEMPVSYGFKRKHSLKINEYIKMDYKELDHPSNIMISMDDRYSETKGHVTRLPSSEVFRELEFKIHEEDWKLSLSICFHKARFKNDDIFLMINKLRMAIFNVLENGEQMVDELNLITKKEERTALTFIEPKQSTTLKSLYEQFVTTRLKHADSIAMTENGKSYTYLKLSASIAKLSKTVEKSIESGDVIAIDSPTSFDQVVGILVADHLDAVYTKHMDKAKWVVKKGLFGFKVVKQGSQNQIGAQYIDQNYISKVGYQNYCEWFRFFALSHEDKVLVNNNLLAVGVPALVSGTPITIGESSEIDALKATFAVLNKNELVTYATLKHAIVHDKVIDTQVSYDLTYAKGFNETTPYAIAGKMKNNRLHRPKPINGIGLLILNKQMQLTQTFEKGQLTLHGQSVMMNDHPPIKVKGISIENPVKLNDKASWFIDESIRL